MSNKQSNFDLDKALETTKKVASVASAVIESAGTIITVLKGKK